MQAYVGRARAESFSLTADMMYVSQNAPRICRALFEICLRRGGANLTARALQLCKMVTRRMWGSQVPVQVSVCDSCLSICAELPSLVLHAALLSCRRV